MNLLKTHKYNNQLANISDSLYNFNTICNIAILQLQ
jgi:hypothetical protein